MTKEAEVDDKCSTPSTNPHSKRRQVNVILEDDDFQQSATKTLKTIKKEK